MLASEPLYRSRQPTGTTLSIHTADSESLRGQADELIERMYAWRGYTTSPAEHGPDRLTLIACKGQRPIATMTIGIDAPGRFSAESLYPDRIGAVRCRDARPCEITRFAVTRRENSLGLLATLFHIAFMCARRFGCTDVLAEVNPRHVAFYTRMLGFERCGSIRHCSRVEAPAVLLRLSLAYAEEQIAIFAGQAQKCPRPRSLYPLALSCAEAARVGARLARHHARALP